MFGFILTLHGQTSRMLICCFAIVLIAIAGTLEAEEPKKPSNAEIAFFESKIRPLLANHCVDCHGEDTQESSLRLDTYEGLVEGGSSGPAVVPNDLQASLLITAVNYDNEHLRMPPDEKLSAGDIRLLKEWIEKGAPHPDRSNLSMKPRRGTIDLTEARKFWAFQPVSAPSMPKIDGLSPNANPIDAFILNKMLPTRVVPNPPADKRTLIRRVTFDLTGLPPTPEEVAQFLADESSDAFEKVVDRLLASPQYGERWGRHWLDVVRYADSNGQDENQAFVDAWRYRNYVIDAFNKDKPYDRFLSEQIAGDLLPLPETPAEDNDRFAPLVATGFLELGPKVLAEKDQVKMEMDIIDEQIDTFGQAFLGMTIACARCHDHKFDPISTADYYALAGIFKSTKSMQSYNTTAKYNERILATEEEQRRKAELEAQKKQKQTELEQLVATAKSELLKTLEGTEAAKLPPDAEQQYPEQTRQHLQALRSDIQTLTDQIPTFTTAMAVEEGKAADVAIHVRGSHLVLGKSVARGVPKVLQAGTPLEISEAESGRLQLARWLVSPENPLTARVAMNRLWQWHFGTGLVATTNNFGKLGEVPSHPDLLDWLAAEFVSRGWSIKAMHKQILLSDVYQRSSQANPDNERLDAENRLLWRANIQRLDAEALRDSLLAVSGTLDTTQGTSMLALKKWELVSDHTSKDNTSYDSLRRSIYLPVIRNNLYDGFSLFDFATADIPIGQRATSTVAPQALYVMNSELFLSAANAFAERLFREVPDDDKARVIRMYELALTRPPDDVERQRLLKYVAQLEQVIAADSNITDVRLAAWAVVCQSILGCNEFSYCK